MVCLNGIQVPFKLFDTVNLRKIENWLKIKKFNRISDLIGFKLHLKNIESYRLYRTCYKGEGINVNASRLFVNSCIFDISH